VGLEAFTGTYTTYFFSQELIYCGTVHRRLYKEASWYYYSHQATTTPLPTAKQKILEQTISNIANITMYHHINRSIKRNKLNIQASAWNPCSILKERIQGVTLKSNSHLLGNKLSKMLQFKFKLQPKMEGFLKFIVP
jgi:hypothetical protein